MKQLRGLPEDLLRAFCATTIIFSFCLSLILPYTSDYYARDQRVVLKQANRNVTAKLEVSTIIPASPAECKTLENSRVISLYCRITILHLSSYWSPSAAMREEIAVTRYLNTAFELVSAHPSRVIILRKLLI